MDPKKLFADERHAAFCVFCGDKPTTREHAASKILLDDPLPADLPLVYSCHACNNSYSRDEEYLACLIDCVISGSTDSDAVMRKKVAASLRHSPALAARIATAREADATGQLFWRPEWDRVRNVVVKLARGHAAHQYSEPQLDAPESVSIVPLPLLSPEQRETFETPPESLLLPELGSRAFIRVLLGGDPTYDRESGWMVLQEGHYRYVVAQSGGIMVRIVLSEYLACEVMFSRI